MAITLEHVLGVSSLSDRIPGPGASSSEELAANRAQLWGVYVETADESPIYTPLPGSRVYRIVVEDRTLVIPPESRTLRIKFEDRRLENI